MSHSPSEELKPSTGTSFGQWMALIAALLGWMFDGFELGLLPLVARPALNQLLDTATADRIASELSRLGREEFPEIESALTRAAKHAKDQAGHDEIPIETSPPERPSRTPPTLDSALSDVQNHQARTLETLKELQNLLSKGRDQRDVSRELNSLIDEQEVLQQDSTLLVRQTLSKSGSSLSPQQESDLTNLVPRQSKVAERVDLFRKHLQQAAKSFVDLWEGVWIAGFLVGMSTGGVVFGWLGDRIGRVRAMTLSVFAYSVFSGLCAFSQTAEQFFLLRFVAALGMGGEWSLGVALVMEIWPNRSRALLSGLIGAAANVGFLLVALFALGLANFIQSAHSWLLATGLPQDWVSALVANQGWRLLMLLGAAPAVLTFFIRLAVPESEKWLHAKEQGATSQWASRDLLGVVAGAAGALLIVFVWSREMSVAIRVVGSVIGLTVALVGYIYPVFQFLKRTRVATGGPDELRQTLNRLLIGACLSAVALIGTWASIQRAPSWANDFAKQAAIKQNLSADEVKSASISARAQAQIYSAIGAIVGTIGGALLGNAISRRATFALLCLGSLISSVVFFQVNTTFGPLFLATVFVAGGMTASFYGWLPLYLPELFRTNVRATAQGFSFNFGRILAAVAALQTGNLIGLFKGGLPMACSVMSLIYVVGMMVIWLGPETKDRPLPE